MILEDNALIKRVSPSQKQVAESVSLLDKKLTADLQQIATANQKRAAYLTEKTGPSCISTTFPLKKQPPRSKMYKNIRRRNMPGID